MTKIKCIFTSVLCMAAMLFSSCGNAAPDTESAAKEIPKQSEFEIYDRFSAAEVENMRYSKLALFSLTCDYDTKELKFRKAGEEIEVVYKLTNMTDITLHTELQVLSGESLEDMAYILPDDMPQINPVATGYVEEKIFEPYETVSIPVTLTVPEDCGGCYIYAGIGMQLFDEEVIERMQMNYCGITLDKMYAAVKK